MVQERKLPPGLCTKTQTLTLKLLKFQIFNKNLFNSILWFSWAFGFLEVKIASLLGASWFQGHSQEKPLALLRKVTQKSLGLQNARVVIAAWDWWDNIQVIFNSPAILNSGLIISPPKHIFFGGLM